MIGYLPRIVKFFISYLTSGLNTLRHVGQVLVFLKLSLTQKHLLCHIKGSVSIFNHGSSHQTCTFRYTCIPYFVPLITLIWLTFLSPRPLYLYYPLYAYMFANMSDDIAKLHVINFLLHIYVSDIIIRQKTTWVSKYINVTIACNILYYRMQLVAC